MQAISLPLPASQKGTVADTFCDPSVTEPMTAQPIDPPTVTMSFIVNDSPLAGTEGDKVTSRVIRDRLYKEAEGNVALKIEEAADKDSFYVSGRGELQLAVLIETMRREGFELAVSRPRVVMQEDENGNKLEPVEEVVIDVDEEYSGTVVQKMSERKGEMIELRPSGANRVRLVFHAPTRGLIGYQSELMTDTRGTAIMNRLFHAYEPYKGPIGGRVQGVLISHEQGESVAYAMFNLEDRGPFIIDSGEKVYAGMIIGIHTRDNDLEVNVLKGKKLTNMRASGKDEAVKLTPPIRMTLERALSWIQDDELVEVTPKSFACANFILIPMSANASNAARTRALPEACWTVCDPFRALQHHNCANVNHISSQSFQAVGFTIHGLFFCKNRLLVNEKLTYALLMSTITVNTRRARREDSEAIARVHDQSWNNAYSGMVPHSALNRMVQRRGPAWWLKAIDRHTVILVLEMQDRIVGYATIGRNRVQTLPHGGEIYEIYLLPEYQGVGFGSHLFLSAMSELKRRSLSGTVVWVLADNAPAIRFYENAGGRKIAEGKETFDGKDLKKIAFGWD